MMVPQTKRRADLRVFAAYQGTLFFNISARARAFKVPGGALREFKRALEGPWTQGLEMARARL